MCIRDRFKNMLVTHSVDLFYHYPYFKCLSTVLHTLAYNPLSHPNILLHFTTFFLVSRPIRRTIDLSNLDLSSSKTDCSSVFIFYVLKYISLLFLLILAFFPWRFGVPSEHITKETNITASFKIHSCDL